MTDETASDRLQAHYGNEYPITLCGLGVVAGGVSPPVQDDRLAGMEAAARSWMEQYHRVFGERERLRKALDGLLACSGARGRYHAMEYADAVAEAEAALVATPAPDNESAADRLWDEVDRRCLKVLSADNPEETPAEEIDRLARRMVAIAPQAGRYVGVLIYDTSDGLRKRLLKVVSSLPATPTKGTE